MEEQKKAILLVDDEPDFLEIFGTLLRSAGYEVRTASAAEEGIKSAKEQPPALILMDVQMPGLNGVEALMQLKDDPATENVKVAFLTNLGNADAESEMINSLASQDIQAEGYIKKTEDLSEIVSEVKKYIA